MDSSRIIEIWPVFVSIIFAGVWLIRLEAKVLYLEKNQSSHLEKLDQMNNKLQEISESLARMEGKLHGNTHD